MTAFLAFELLATALVVVSMWALAGAAALSLALGYEWRLCGAAKILLLLMGPLAAVLVVVVECFVGKD